MCCEFTQETNRYPSIHWILMSRNSANKHARCISDIAYCDFVLSHYSNPASGVKISNHDTHIYYRYTMDICDTWIYIQPIISIYPEPLAARGIIIFEGDISMCHKLYPWYIYFVIYRSRILLLFPVFVVIFWNFIHFSRFYANLGLDILHICMSLTSWRFNFVLRKQVALRN